MNAADLCVRLDWDSSFFGVSIARLTPGTVTADDAARAVSWARAHGVACLYALVPTADSGSRQALASQGFEAVDERLTLARALSFPTAAPQESIRLATTDDIPALGALARSSHHNTRFYVDGHFDRARCDELYATWITQSTRTPDSHVLVADASGVLIGYVSVQNLGASRARIGLVAVAPEARGKGLGRALLKAALQTAAESGSEEIDVVTQGGHQGAVAYYVSAGFAPTHSETWYHAWFGDAA